MIIGICDDNGVDRNVEKEICNDVIKKLYSHVRNECSFITYESGEELIRCNDDLDILILDIEMKKNIWN